MIYNLDYIKDKIGEDGQDWESYARRFAPAIELLLTAAPSTIVELSDDADAICKACVRTNDLGVGLSCLREFPANQSRDALHRAVLSYLTEGSLPADSKLVKYQPKVERVDLNGKEGFRIPIGVLRDVTFLLGYRQLREEQVRPEFVK